MHDHNSIESTDLLDELLEVDGRDVLDVGCGDGWVARRLAGAGARVVGVDPQPEALDRARAGGTAPGIRYLQAAAQELPLPEKSFDVVIFFNSLHHVPVAAMDAAIAEAARVLRPEGLLYVQEPLAAGEFFALISTIEDETEVRAQALAALERAGSGPFTEVARRDASMTVSIADFEALRKRMTGVDPARAAAIDADAAALRDRFERAGRPSDSGRALDQPIRVHLFKLAS